MQFKDGTHVYTTKGETVGRVDRVVIDPRTKEVTHIVVRQGLLFPEDKLVDVNLLVSATDDNVVLRKEVDDFSKLPPFEETHYISPPADEIPYPTPGIYPMYGYPPYGMFPVGMYATPAPATYTERNLAEHQIPLKSGVQVISSDDHHVGDLEEVLTNTTTDQITHLVISQGLLFKERKLVPSTWIQAVDEAQVTLAVSSTVLDGLPDYRPTS